MKGEEFTPHILPGTSKQFERFKVMNPTGAEIWYRALDGNLRALCSRWSISRFSANPDAYMGLVLECHSQQHGSVVIKMYPPFLRERYDKEAYILRALDHYCQCTLLDTCPEQNAMLLEKVTPGSYISYPRDVGAIEVLFRQMAEHKVPISCLKDLAPSIRGVLEQAEWEYPLSGKYGYHPQKISYLLKKAKEVYLEFFSKEEKYLLHGDVYFKNALWDAGGIRIIDPFGYRDAYIFEYMPFFTYELFLHSQPGAYQEDFRALKTFFSRFTDTSKFTAASFVFLVRQLIPSIYEGNDHFQRADGYLRLIESLYLDENGTLLLEKPLM